ncbi:hypothetical protein ACX0G9_28880 [Flavitalea flava]
MNQLIFKTSNAVRLFILTIVVSSISLSTFACEPSGEDRNRENHTGSATTAEVSYLGSQNGEPLFNVLYNNTTGSRFSLEVLDGDGMRIFLGSYNDKTFDKKFRVADASSNSKLTFIIRNFQDNSVQHFEVNSNTRLVEEVEVKAL